MAGTAYGILEGSRIPEGLHLDTTRLRINRYINCMGHVSRHLAMPGPWDPSDTRYPTERSSQRVQENEPHLRDRPMTRSSCLIESTRSGASALQHLLVPPSPFPLCYWLEHLQHRNGV